MRNPFLRSKLAVVTLLAVFAACSVLYWTGCSDNQDTANPVTGNQQPSLVKMSADDPAVQSVMAIQDRHTASLMKDNNVVGTATGLTDDGQLAVIVYLKLPAAGGKGGRTASSIPTNIDGIPVVQRVTGEFKAMKGGGGVSHTAKQTAPISLGTSGGWRYDLANGYCCGGTIGSLIQKGGNQYVLSNYHVLWSDIVSGGNSRVAQVGDPVIQPGLIDVGCNAANAQDVATLSGSGSLPSANVDAGYAQVIPGMVRSDGAILEVGTISATTVSAFIGQGVKKSGRTTGLSRSSVSGLNATVNIQYENECAGSPSFVKTFTGQIVISNRGSKFLNSGDSGSLMVEDATTNPHAVGLLYAGSSFDAIANPINAVLSWAGATMVGQ
jgi:hypothetical protein